MKKYQDPLRQWLHISTQRRMHPSLLLDVFGLSTEQSKTTTTRRVTERTLKLGFGKTLHIKFRRFRTHPKHRSSAYRQLVLKTDILGIREVCLRVRGRRKNHRLWQLAWKLDPSKAIMAFGFAGIVYFGIQLGTTNAAPPVVTVMEPPKQTATQTDTIGAMSKSNPTSIVIPTLGINAAIHPVSMLANGELETPDIFSGNVGWYDKSPTPGEIGPSVLVGHVDTYKGPSVFWNLSTITPNSEIQIARADGTVATFIVRSVMQYDQNNFPTTEVYGNISHAGLRLITCGGTFNYMKGRYSANTVVYADLIK